SLVRSPVQLRAHAEIQRRKPEGQLAEGRDEISSQAGIAALHRARIRALFRLRHLLRDSQQHLCDDSLPAHFSARLWIHGDDVALPGRTAKSHSGGQATLERVSRACYTGPWTRRT